MKNKLIVIALLLSATLGYSQTVGQIEKDCDKVIAQDSLYISTLKQVIVNDELLVNDGKEINVLANKQAKKITLLKIERDIAVIATVVVAILLH